MNFNWTTLALLLLLATKVPAQLTLERAGGKRLKQVQIGANLIGRGN